MPLILTKLYTKTLQSIKIVSWEQPYMAGIQENAWKNTLNSTHRTRL